MVARRPELYQPSIISTLRGRTRHWVKRQTTRTNLEKKGYVWKRLRYCPPAPKSTGSVQAKQANWLMLKLWAKSGLICLEYLDESGFERSSPLTYTYAQRGVQKRIQQPRERSRRISALGLWEPGRGFEYGLVVGGFNSNRYIALMTWQACRSAKRLATTGQLTVIIQDGASSHKSKLVKQHWQQWQELGLLIFFLPPYSP